MCGRYRLDIDWTDIVRLYNLTWDGQVPIPYRYNVAPTDRMPIVVVRDGARRLQLARWGLLAPWATHPRDGAKCINAKSETAATTASFKVPMVKRRCLVPTTGFYEWRKGPGKTKTPLWIRPREGGVLTVAGLWQPWRHPETGEWLDSYTILTTGANALVAPIHDRMPVVLPPDAWDRWLDPQTPMDTLTAMLRPAPEGLLEAVEVSAAIGNVANDTAEAGRAVGGAPGAA